MHQLEFPTKHLGVYVSNNSLAIGVELAEVCEVVIELYYQEVRLVLDNIYMQICLVHNHVTDHGVAYSTKVYV